MIVILQKRLNQSGVSITPIPTQRRGFGYKDRQTGQDDERAFENDRCASCSTRRGDRVWCDACAN
jgi:hypothetical protein